VDYYQRYKFAGVEDITWSRIVIDVRLDTAEQYYADVLI